MATLEAHFSQEKKPLYKFAQHFFFNCFFGVTLFLCHHSPKIHENEKHNFFLFFFPRFVTFRKFLLLHLGESGIGTCRVLSCSNHFQAKGKADTYIVTTPLFMKEHGFLGPERDRVGRA